MKKRMSRILSVLLISALVVSTAEVAHAEDVTEPVREEVQAVEAVEEVVEDKAAVEEVAEPVEETVEEVAEAVKEEPKAEQKEEPKAEEAAPAEVSEEVPEMKEESQKTAAGKALESMDILGETRALDTKAVVTGSIPVKMAVNGTEVPDMGVITYNSNNVKGTKCGYSQAVRFSAKGTLDMAVLVDSTSYSGVSFGVFRDANMTSPVDSCGSASPGDSEEDIVDRVFKIPSAGTYYIGLYSPRGTNANYYAAASAIFYNGADRTLANGSQIAVGQKDPQTNYFAFKATANGYITTVGDSTAQYYKVAICNSSKKALSGDTYLRYNPTYGVKKGTWYYIRVTSSYNSAGGYVFKATNASIKEKSGKTKKKAVTIKQKKTKKGTITAGSKQADWYKFKLKKKKSVRIYFKGRTNDRFKVTVYKGGRNIGSRTFWYSDASMTLKSLGKWTKGTYYIKVQRASSTSSGWYSLKWK